MNLNLWAISGDSFKKIDFVNCYVKNAYTHLVDRLSTHPLLIKMTVMKPTPSFGEGNHSPSWIAMARKKNTKTHSKSLWTFNIMCRLKNQLQNIVSIISWILRRLRSCKLQSARKWLKWSVNCFFLFVNCNYCFPNTGTHRINMILNFCAFY